MRRPFNPAFEPINLEINSKVKMLDVTPMTTIIRTKKGKSSTSIRSEAAKAFKALTLSFHKAKNNNENIAKSTIKAATYNP